MRRHKSFKPSTETLEKARMVKKFIEKKYQKLYQEEKIRKEYIDRLVQHMQKLNLEEEDQETAQELLKRREVAVWRQRRAKIKVSDFDSVAIIGKGAFGEVRLCREREGDCSLVAIKKMKKEEMIKKNQLKHVIAEREILAQADNPWIVDLYSSFTDIENLYLVMEYLPGGDLMNQLIKRDIFTEEETRFYMVELVLAIDSVHQLNYIHRDIKPDNILLDKEGHVKLSDFGLCKYYENSRHLQDLWEQELNRRVTHEGSKERKKRESTRKRMLQHRARKKVYSMVGTIDYIAPEVFGKKGYTESVDWWSLGTIMFEMMVGYPPFVASDAAKTCHKIIQWEKNFDIPEDVELSPCSEDLIRALINHPEKRLGAKGVDEIKSHPFFRGVQWEGYRKRERAPHKPNLKNEEDVGNFDDFEDDGTWVPADNLKGARGLAGKKYEHESMFIGYSFKKQVDPQMNQYVEGLVEELRKKKRSQRKKHASQDKLHKGEEMRAKLEPKNRFKKKPSGNTDTLEVIEMEDRDMFKTSEAGKRLKRPVFKLGRGVKASGGKIGSTYGKFKPIKSKTKGWTKNKKSKRADVKDAEILAGPPRNLTKKGGVGKNKLKLGHHFSEKPPSKLGASRLKTKARASNSRLKGAGGLSNRRLKMVRTETPSDNLNSSRSKLGSKKNFGSKKNMRPVLSSKKDPKFLELKKKKFHNVYDQNRVGSMRSSKLKSTKNYGKQKSGLKMGSDRKSLKKKLSTEKGWGGGKFKSYGLSSESGSNKRLSNSGKNRLNLVGYSSSKKKFNLDLEGANGHAGDSMYSKSSAQGFYGRKKSRKQEANLYYSNVKAKYQNNSARNLEGKTRKVENSKLKPFNSHVRADKDVFKKQYRSNIYDNH